MLAGHRRRVHEAALRSLGPAVSRITKYSILQFANVKTKGTATILGDSRDLELSMSNRSKTPSDEVERLLSAVEPDHRRRKVRESVDVYFEAATGLSDNRGRRSAELKKVATTLRHIAGMQRWVEDTRYDLNVRRRIKGFLRHIDHRQPWRRTVEESSKARGLVNRAARTRNERIEYGPGDATDLGVAHMVVPLNSEAKLRSAGRRGSNCLGDNCFGYLDDLRHRQAEFYEVKRSGVAVAWLRVERESREITEIQGPYNEEPDLPVNVLWHLCRELNVNGDEECLFLANGVLSMFLDGKAEPETPMCVVRGYRFWSRAGEVVVHDMPNNKWSRFRGAWCAAASSHLEGNAFEVMGRLEPRIASFCCSARPVRHGGRRRPKMRAGRGLAW